LADNKEFLEALCCGTLGDKEIQQIQYAGQSAQLFSVPKNVSSLQYLTQRNAFAITGIG